MISSLFPESEKIEKIEFIKEALIKACIKSRPSYFKPFLSSEKVTTEWPDKESFYKFFKYMLSNSRKMSVGELNLIIRHQKEKNKNVQYYEFYDQTHVHSRLTLIIEESNETIHIEILPF
jgi:GH15 family glucan-1,4-alpha-glucosidase